jgi:hypothetical protein
MGTEAAVAAMMVAIVGMAGLASVAVGEQQGNNAILLQKVFR